MEAAKSQREFSSSWWECWVTLSFLVVTPCTLTKHRENKAFTRLLWAYLTHHGTQLIQWVISFSSSSRSGISSQQALLWCRSWTSLSLHFVLPPALRCASGQFLSPLWRPCEQLGCIPTDAEMFFPLFAGGSGVWYSQCEALAVWMFSYGSLGIP